MLKSESVTYAEIKQNHRKNTNVAIAFHKNADKSGKKESNDGFCEKNGGQGLNSETLEKGSLGEIIDLDGAAAHHQLNGGNPKQRFYLIRIDPQRFPKEDYGLGPLH
jgi:hypothetical protein